MYFVFNFEQIINIFRYFYKFLWLSYLKVHIHAVFVCPPVSAIVKDSVTDWALVSVVIIGVVVVGHSLQNDDFNYFQIMIMIIVVAPSPVF